MENKNEIEQFRYIKIQPKQMDIKTGLWGINTEFGGFTSSEPHDDV